MTTLAERFVLTQNDDLLARTRMAAVAAAINVAAETVAADAAQSAIRKALAGKVLKAPTAWATVFAFGVASNPNAGTGVSDPVTDDNSLSFVVASLWNAYASAAATN